MSRRAHYSICVFRFYQKRMVTVKRPKKSLKSQQERQTYVVKSQTKRPRPLSLLTVQNVVYTSRLVIENKDGKFDLLDVAVRMHGRYAPSRFPAPSFRSIDFYGKLSTLSLFKSGKCVFPGLKQKDNALLAQHSFCDRLESFYATKIHVTKFKLENIVGSMALGRLVDLDKLDAYLSNLPKNGNRGYPRITHEYVPNTFTGLQLWWVRGLAAPEADETRQRNKGGKSGPKESKVVLIVFDRGTVVIAGARVYEEMVYMVHLCCELITSSGSFV